MHLFHQFDVQSTVHTATATASGDCFSILKGILQLLSAMLVLHSGHKNPCTRSRLLNTNIQNITCPHAPRNPRQEDSNFSVARFLIHNAKCWWKKLHYLWTGISLRPTITFLSILRMSTLLISHHNRINGPSGTRSLQVPTPIPKVSGVWHTKLWLQHFKDATNQGCSTS